MSKRRSHKDVEFTVSGGSPEEREHKTFAKASVDIMNRLTSSGEATLDVLVWSEAGARWLAGDDGVDSYREDPDASVFERYTFKCNAEGKVR